MKATARSINAALRRERIPLEFVSTRKGYQYFVFDDGYHFETYSEFIAYVSDLSVDQWIARAKIAHTIIVSDIEKETP